MDISIISLPFLKIIYTIIVIIVTYITIKIVNYILNNLKRLQKNITLIDGVKDIAKYIICIISLILIFKVFGIDLEGLFVSIGIISIAVTFAAKDIISNFMAGFFLITDNTLKVGDIVDINSLKGEIKKIGLRNTIIITELGDTITVPNSVLSVKPYTKFKKNELKKVTINVTLPLIIDIEEYDEEILEIINNNEGILKNPKAIVDSKEITSEGSIILIKFWVKKFNKKEEYKLIITNQCRELINKKIGDYN